MKSLMISMLLYGSPSAQAVNCFGRSTIDAYQGVTHFVAVINKDNRQTEQEYANSKKIPLEQIQNRFAATGEMKCGNEIFSAQLTGANNVITTVAHGFWNNKTCIKISDPLGCTFTVKVGNEEYPSKVTALVGAGFRCPPLPEAYDDWAVLKIDPPLEGINFYQVPNFVDYSEKQKVTSVAASNHDFIRKDPANGQPVMPKTIDECEVLLVKYWNHEPISGESTCDTGKGASGGSVLGNIDGKDIIYAINSTNDETAQMIKDAARSGKIINKGPYVPGKWKTYQVPLAGNFLRTVHKALGH